MLKVCCDHSFILAKEIINHPELKDDSHKVFVFTVNLLEYEEDIKILWECLSTREQLKANKYYTEDLRKKYIISHGILRHILSYYAAQLPQELEFVYHRYGKPFLRNSSIQFNMSHSHDLVSYIISPHYYVGIDIEWRDVDLDVCSLSDLVLTLDEHNFMLKLEPLEKLGFFYKLWTAKEAVIKADGRGMSYPINTINAMSPTLGQKIWLNNDDKPIQEWYHFPLHISAAYSGAIAIERRINQIVFLEIGSHNFPKGTDLSIYSKKDLDEVALMLNSRPRKTLGFLTPFDKLKQVIALTA